VRLQEGFKEEGSIFGKSPANAQAEKPRIARDEQIQAYTYFLVKSPTGTRIRLIIERAGNTIRIGCLL